MKIEYIMCLISFWLGFGLSCWGNLSVTDFGFYVIIVPISFFMGLIIKKTKKYENSNNL